ncbi:hypothetical protein HNP98_003934 [Hymenobacter sp. 9A]|uniref:Uncharacterized protein n=1 Tax=Hymenobacter caeli TaxID=2735894 RepID=A0ABX2FVB8_9BACT|nr:hypothetical protein [Hymenobacter caeli]
MTAFLLLQKLVIYPLRRYSALVKLTLIFT